MYIFLLLTFLTIFNIMSSDLTFLTSDIFYHSTFCPNRPFLLSTLFLFGVLSHSTLCPIRHFLHSILCLFGILSHSTLCPFDIFYHSTFCHSTFFTFGVCYFDILSVNLLPWSLYSTLLLYGYRLPWCKRWVGWGWYGEGGHKFIAGKVGGRDRRCAGVYG